MNSPVTSTVTKVPVKSRTSTDLEIDETGPSKRFFGARFVLLVIALGVNLPHPVSAWWGAVPSDTAVWTMALVGLLWAAAVLGARRYLVRHGLQSDRGVGAAGTFLLLDIVLLTVLLGVSGAAQNPFTLLYFVPITLATMVAPKWTFRVAGASVLGFVLLLLVTARELGPHVGHAHHAHFFEHVRGMAVALAVAGVFVTYFVHRIAFELLAQRRRIDVLFREQQEDRFAVTLGALSAGAAHELGSPLGTIQILAEELPHTSGEDQIEAVASISREIARIKRVLHTMSSSELSAQVLGEGQEWELSELAGAFRSLDVPVTIERDERTSQPLRVVEQIARELVRNAQRVASPGGVSAHLDAQGKEISISVSDDGPGLTSVQLARAQQPFVSDSGGTGLGLFLATVHARQLGGRLELGAAPAGGTVARLVLPVRSPFTLVHSGKSESP